jgi:osmoprotectant transport system ATP-binding protein
MIEIENVTKRYGETAVVDAVSMVIEPRTVTVIVGTSGSGKTTLLRMINRLVEPTSGVIRLDGVDNRSVPGHALRRSIGYAIQGHGLFPHRTVAQNIATVPVLLGWDQSRIEKRVHELLSLFQLDQAAFGPRYPHELSGGQQQRVGIVRALALRPDLLLFDEPTSSLDPELVGEVLSVMKELAEEGWTMVVVTHELQFARAAADEVLFLDGGVVVERGAPAQLFTAPREARTRQFLHRLLHPLE